jgi:hypothetical protein
MQQVPRPPRPAILQVSLVVAGLLLFAAIYILVMHSILDVSRVVSKHDADFRDKIYLVVHIGLLAAAVLAGFALGKWLNGLGVAFALLFFIALATTMVGAQAGSYELACHGHNDVVRHWTC